MKKAFFPFALIAFLIVFCSGAAVSQDKGRKSPPQREVQELTSGGTVTIEYSQPSVRGRKIFGGLVPYGKLWRTGANEATVIEFSRNVKINGKPVKAGKYAMFTIPGEETWTVILNNEPEQWGAYRHEDANDVARITVKPQQADFTEELTFDVKGSGVVTLDWENTRILFQIE